MPLLPAGPRTEGGRGGKGSGLFGRVPAPAVGILLGGGLGILTAWVTLPAPGGHGTAARAHGSGPGPAASASGRPAADSGAEPALALAVEARAVPAKHPEQAAAGGGGERPPGLPPETAGGLPDLVEGLERFSRAMTGCNAEAHTEYAGDVALWGADHLVDTAEECCGACVAHSFGLVSPGHPCNAWVFCGDEAKCGAMFRQCWLKYEKHLTTGDPDDPQGVPIVVAAGADTPWTSGHLLGAFPHSTVLRQAARDRAGPCASNGLANGAFCLADDGMLDALLAVDRKFVRRVAEEFLAGKSVVDLGAGLGAWEKTLLNKGIRGPAKLAAYDGMPGVAAATGGVVQPLDLTIEQDVGRFDWVLSIDVGHHIPVRGERAFVQNIANACGEGALVSWAEGTLAPAFPAPANPKPQASVSEAFARLSGGRLKVNVAATEKVAGLESAFGLNGRTIVFDCVATGQS